MRCVPATGVTLAHLLCIDCTPRGIPLVARDACFQRVPAAFTAAIATSATSTAVGCDSHIYHAEAAIPFPRGCPSSGERVHVSPFPSYGLRERKHPCHSPWPAGHIADTLDVFRIPDLGSGRRNEGDRSANAVEHIPEGFLGFGEKHICKTRWNGGGFLCRLPKESVLGDGGDDPTGILGP